MLYKLCPRCGRKIEYTCKECPNGCNKKAKKNNNKLYDTYSRNKDSKAIYESKQWKNLTYECADRFSYVDIYSLYVLDEIEHGALSHHVIDIVADSSRAYDIDNLVWLNATNHMYVHSMYNKSERDKKEMQKLLFSLIKRWQAEYQLSGGRG